MSVTDYFQLFRLAKRKSQEIQSEETASSFKESPAKKTKTDDKPNKELVAMLLGFFFFISGFL